jgi:small redox-active disulfide protein 2
MLTIKILGAGCAKCKKLNDKVIGVVRQRSIDAEIIKVEDLNEMMKYGIMMTPALVINEHLKSCGTVPEDTQIIKWINDEMI